MWKRHAWVGGSCAVGPRKTRRAVCRAAMVCAEMLESRTLLNAVVAPPDPVVGPVSSPLPPRPGHTFYVQGSASTWDQASAITPNTTNDLILNAVPTDTDYVPHYEAVNAPQHENPQPNTIAILTNGTAQSLVNASGNLDQAGTPDGHVSDPSDPTNVIADLAVWHATYSLGSNPNGYDISEIDSITGHQDGRTQQHIDIEVEPVGSSQFISLSNGQGFSFTRTGGAATVTLDKGSAQMAIVSGTPGQPIAANIRAIRFDNLPGDQAFFRELVVSGTPSNSTPAAPAAPTRLAAVADPATGAVDLTWTDNAADEAGYLIQRASGLAGPFTTVGSIASVPGTGQTAAFVDTGITVAGSYWYQVVAVGPNSDAAAPASNIAGPVAITTVDGAEAHFYNQGYWAGTPALSQHVNVAIDFTWDSGSGDPSIRTFADSVAFTGKVTTDQAGTYTFISNTDDAGYLYVNGVLVSSDPGRHASENATILTPVSLAANTSYDFVFLENNDSNGAAAHLEWITPAMVQPALVPYDHLRAVSDAPQPPAQLALAAGAASNPSAARADFTFLSNNVAVVHYVLERSDDGGQTWAAVNQIDPASATQNSAGGFAPALVRIEDASTLPGQSYGYRALAENFDGSSAPSNVVSIATPPAAPARGVEGRFYNGEMASAADGQDPRNFALAGLAPTEFVADAGGITAGAAGPIDSSFGYLSPDPTPSPDIPRVHPDSFATVWTGKIVTDHAGVYTFFVNSDDDGYFWVNDVLVSSAPGDHGQGQPVQVIPLTLAADTAYNFVLIQQQRSGPSGVSAAWIEPGQTAATAIPAYVAPLLGNGDSGGFEQVMDVPHEQVIDPATGNYAVDDPAASAAGDLTVAGVSSTAGVMLHWVDQSPSELWFEVQRTTDDPTSPTAAWIDVGQTGFDTGSFTDSTATDAGPAKVYSYRVRGVNFDGDGPWSNLGTTNHIVLPTPTLVAQACMPNTVQLSIFGQSPNASGIEVQYSTDGIQWMDAAGSPLPGTAATFTFTGLDAAATYLFRARNLPGPQVSDASPFSAIVSASGAGPTPIDFSGGFATAPGLQLNGSAVLTGPSDATPNALRLTANVLNEAGSALAVKVQNVTSFQTRFDFAFPQTGGPGSDGFTFVIENDPAGPGAIGGGGGSLGYAGVRQSVAIKFDLYDNSGEGFDSTGLFVNGDDPMVPQGGNPVEVSLDMTPSGVNLHAAGDRFQAALSYDGTTLTETVADLTTGAVFTHAYAVNIPQIVGGPCAYVGFTGATGGGSAEQDITNWTYVGTPATIVGTGGNDTITLKRDPDGAHVDWSVNGGGVTAIVPAGSPAGLSIDGAGGNDTIVLDYSNGNPLPNLLRVDGNFTLQGLTGLSFGQTIDLTSGTLAIAYSGPSPLSFIQGYLRSGFDGGRWDGNGISSSLALHPGMAVADVDTGSAVVLSLRRPGDVNGDGTVNFTDLIALAQNYGRSGAGIDWSHGDLSYDGAVDFQDLLLLAQNYGQGSAAGVAAPAADSLFALRRTRARLRLP